MNCKCTFPERFSNFPPTPINVHQDRLRDSTASYLLRSNSSHASRPPLYGRKRLTLEGSTIITGAAARISFIRGTNYVSGDYIISRRCIDLPAVMPIVRSTPSSCRSSVYLLKRGLNGCRVFSERSLCQSVHLDRRFARGLGNRTMKGGINDRQRTRQKWIEAGVNVVVLAAIKQRQQLRQ